MHLYNLQNESEEYRTAREDLLQAEMALRDQRERVTALRRRLPPGPVVQDYIFQEGPLDLEKNSEDDFFETKLSELFAVGKNSLIIEHLMYGPDWEEACPMCSMWLDGYNGVAHHLLDRTNIVVVAKAGIGKIRALGRKRGWRNLRLLSSRENTFTHDFGMEPNGEQMPGITAFHRENDGTIRQFYTSGAVMASNEYRGLDLISPVWNLFDLLPEGRGDWMPKLEY